MTKNTRKKYNVAFVLDDGMDQEDGVQQYIKTLAEWMTSEGHQVRYLVGETQRKDINALHSIPKNLKVSFNGNKMTIPIYASKRQIEKILKKYKFDVIHIQAPYSPVFGAKVVSSAKVVLHEAIVVGTFHIAPYSSFARQSSRLLALALANNIRKFDGFVSVSPAAKIFAEEIFKIESEVLPNVVNLKKFESGTKKPAKSKLRLVYLGRLVKRKGCMELIDALGHIEKTFPNLNYELIVCGKGELMEDLKSKVGYYSLDKKVKFKGFVSESEKIHYLRSADIAIFPSYAGESFGIVLIEAMAAKSGVVLGGDNPGYRSVLSFCQEALVDVKNIDNFARQIYGFMTDAKLRSNVGTKQQQHVGRYDVKVVGPKLMQFYKNCKTLKNQR